jgi:death on curing protein
MEEPVWIIKAVVLALHEEQLAEHGGQTGIRDDALLESALNRPQNQHAYGDPDIFDLAAAYAYGIANNHPFVDGNKRTSLVTSETFLLQSDIEVIADESAKVSIWLSLAAGELTEQELAGWFRNHSIKTSQIEEIRPRKSRK